MLALTVSIVCDKFKVNGSVARKVLRDLHSKGLARQCGDSHSSFTLYSGTQAKPPGSAPEKPEKGEKAEKVEKK